MLHLPGDVSQILGASAVHRQVLCTGDKATGGDVGIAVIDSGFYPHPYYSDYQYKITRIAADDTSEPGIDVAEHGTSMLANVLACAPDAKVYGIKIGPDPVRAFNKAMMLPVDVVSLSMSWCVDDPSIIPRKYVPFCLRILTVVAAGITVVAAAGNGNVFSFPALMPEVIAVGGVVVGDTDGTCVWNQSASFSSCILTTRNVPDLCALSTMTWLPIPDPNSCSGDPGSWYPQNGGTSCATAQIAGVCALLRQKNRKLAPWEIRSRIVETAVDVRCGTSASGDVAGKGPDRATGAGLVDALRAWQAV